MECLDVFSLSFFFFKQKTAYEVRISDWSSDVCSSDLRGITSAAKLGVVGGSNGGTMAATVTVQRPDLFRANIAQSPTTDMLGLIRDPIAKSIGLLDYGDADDPEMSEVLAAWSPYHNIKDGIDYRSEESRVGKECVGMC